MGTMKQLDVGEIKEKASGNWASILSRCGIGDEYLVLNKRCGCPICDDGKDRYKFVDKHEGLTYFCNHSCNAQGRSSGTGFDILMGVYAIGFREALDMVNDAVSGNDIATNSQPVRHTAPQQATNKPTDYRARKNALLKMKEYSSRTPSPEGIEYLDSRGLTGMAGKRIDNIQYGNIYCEGDNGWIKKNGAYKKFPAIIGFMSHYSSAPISATKIFLKPDAIRQHLPSDYKFNNKQFFRKTSDEGMAGSAVWFSSAKTRTVHVGEGLETMLAVAKHKQSRSVAACCTANNLANFIVPPHVRKIVVWADLDRSGAGERAALELKKRYEGTCEVTILLPKGEIPAHKKSIDWLDVICG